jgi:hypothetical protein
VRAIDQGQPVQLTLCGEASAQTFVSQPQALLKRFMNIFGIQPAYHMLEKL